MAAALRPAQPDGSHAELARRHPGMPGEAGIAQGGIEEKVGQVDADGERDTKEREDLAAPADRDDANQQQAHQRDDHDHEHRVEKEEHREGEWDQRGLINDPKQQESRCGEQQAQ
ncbi:MAG: hypothetical protein E6I86_11695 [Chloroflexi bacterium]|nr:MAG: hypothetical protein E6I86_11695 [Chloroflexota bacterium]